MENTRTQKVKTEQQQLLQGIWIKFSKLDTNICRFDSKPGPMLLLRDMLQK